MKILGIDPGARITGYGIVETTKKGTAVVAFDEIAFAKGMPISAIMLRLHDEITKIASANAVDTIALENIFLGKSIPSFVTQAHVRGTIILASTMLNIRIFEYTPLEVKRAVVGYGKAEKQQVQMMVRAILKIDKPMSFDTSDALAIAICHANTQKQESL